MAEILIEIAIELLELLGGLWWDTRKLRKQRKRKKKSKEQQSKESLLNKIGIRVNLKTKSSR